MDDPYGKNAESTPPKTVMVSTQSKDHIQDERKTSRPPTTSTLTTDTAVNPVSVENSVELESRPPVPRQSVPSSRIAVKVPRSQRRGLFARATILAEIRDPYQYSYKTKWFIVFLVAYAAAAAPLGSAIFFRMSRLFHVGKKVLWLIER